MSKTDSPCDAIRGLSRLARLTLHRGEGTLRGPSGLLNGTAEFLLPATGYPIAAIAVEGAAFVLGIANFDELTVHGVSASGPFAMTCSDCDLAGTVTSADGSEWILVRSVNVPISIDYSNHNTPTGARVLLDNFDYYEGNAVSPGRLLVSPKVGAALDVQAAGQRVRFEWRTDRDEIRSLLLADALSSSSMTKFSFDISNGLSIDDALNFAYDIATACPYISGNLTNVALIELHDEEGALVRRIAPNPVTTSFVGRQVIPDEDIPRFFEECFLKHQAMRASDRWGSLYSHCGTVESCPTLEQNFSSLTTGLEFVMRNALIDAGQSRSAVDDMQLADLIGSVRRNLNLDIPRHYTSHERWRRLRNAVVHGNTRPHDFVSPISFREIFDKLRLLLFRLSLLSLGFSGHIYAPSSAGRRKSPIKDFSEEHNSFQHLRP